MSAFWDKADITRKWSKMTHRAISARLFAVLHNAAGRLERSSAVAARALWLDMHPLKTGVEL
jgi:hypothetical protein